MLRSMVRRSISNIINNESLLNETSQIYLNDFSFDLFNKKGCQVIQGFICPDELNVLIDLSKKIVPFHYLSRRDFDVDEASQGVPFLEERRGIYYSSIRQEYLGVDYNMIDITNPLNLDVIEAKVKDVFEAIESRIVNKIREFLDSNSLSKRWMNYYNYDSVCWPRALHVDTNYCQVKVFVPTVDILDLRQGPLAYIPGSHKLQLLHRLNQAYNKICGSDLGNDNYDSTFFSSCMALPLFLKAGDILLAVQSGVHGDLPAQAGFSKNFFVWAFHPTEIFS